MAYGNSSEELDLQQYWAIVRRRWLPATAVFSAAVGLAALVTFMQEPVYESKGTLRVKSEAVKGLGDLPIGSGDLDALGQKSNPLETEALVLRSRALANEVIQALDLRNPEGDLLGFNAFSKSLNVFNIGGTDVLQVVYKSGAPEEAAKVVNELMELYINRTIQNNRSEARAAVDFISQELPELEAEVLAAEAAVRQFKEQNQIVALQEESTSAVEVEARLRQQIVNAQSSLKEAESSVTGLREQVNLLSTDETIVSESVLESPGILDTIAQLQELEVELLEEKRRFKSGSPVIANLENNRLALESLLNERINTALGSLPIASPRNLASLRDSIPGGVTRVQTPSGEVAADSDRVDILRQNLTIKLADAEVDRLTLSSSLGVLNQAYESHLQRMSSIPVLEEKLRELERNLNVKQETYETLFTSLQTIQIAENQTIGNARVIDSATFSEDQVPVAPKETLNLVLGGLVGVVLGAAVALLLEVRDRSVKTVSEVKSLLNYTLLGTIPLMNRGKKKTRKNEEAGSRTVILRDSPRSSSSESYRMLQANLKFLSSDSTLQVIIVTSSVPGEGKSTTSANLAASLAELSHRVLVIDSDMRRPRQHQTWGIPNLQGLSNVLVGQAELNTSITPVMDNLHLLTAGVIPPNPLSLLESQRMQALTREFVESYDYVIIDTPPLAVAADALILGKLADGILLVVRPGVANIAGINSARDTLQQSGQNVLGMVINGVLPENEPDSYYYYYAKGYYEDNDTTTTTPLTEEQTSLAESQSSMKVR